MSPARRTLVKVCGVTREQDARAAVEAGADLLGFVLWEGSPRQVEPERAAAILEATPGASGVAVMVRPTPEEALRAASVAGVRRVQLHGTAAGGWPGGFPLEVIFALQMGEGNPATEALPGPPHWLLCDTARAGRWGGTGESFDWTRVARLARERPILLSGGLDAFNVARALAAVRPMGVDASSRLESAPGIKDAARVRDFVAAVRAWDDANP